MGDCSRLSGKLAGSSESRRPSPQLGRAGPKLPAIGLSTALGRRGGPKGQRCRPQATGYYAAGAVTRYLCSYHDYWATACTPLGRSPSYTRAVEPGSVSVGVTYMQPASGLFDVPHIHQRLGATNIEATKPIPVEAVAQNQYHCPGSSSWDVSGDVAGRTGWTSLTEGCGGRTGWRGGRLKSAGCEIGGVVVPRTEDEIPS
jgi:hypothetical protein